MTKSIKSCKLILPVVLIIFISSCSKENGSDDGDDDPINSVIFGTLSVDRIASKFVRVGWFVGEDGGNAITETGICYGLNTNPTINDNKVANGSGLGAFEVRLSGLAINTKYFVRAYAKNNLGVAYSSTESFTTLGVAQLDAVTIGTQTWSKQNLNIEVFKNGDDIPIVTQPNSWAVLNSAGACYWQNNTSYRDQYGMLYNWYAVSDPRGLAPEGWHIPTEDEWNILINYLGGPTVAGGKLKEAGLNHWRSPNDGATNSSGFTALPGSFRDSDPSATYPYSIGAIGIWWSATQKENKGTAYFISNGAAGISKTSDFYQAGFSIRCIKD